METNGLLDTGWLLLGTIAGWYFARILRGLTGIGAAGETSNKEASGRAADDDAAEIGKKGDASKEVFFVSDQKWNILYYFSQVKERSKSPTPVDPTRWSLKSPFVRRIILSVLTILVYVSILVVLFIIAGDKRLPSGISGRVLRIEDLLLEPRIFNLLVGFGIGVWLGAHRVVVLSRCRQAYDAILADGDKASWALQAGAVIAILLLSISIIRPDLLQRFESFKAGEVEAKFADKSPTISATNSSALNAINFSVSDYYRRDAINDWKGFVDSYAALKEDTGSPGPAAETVYLTANDCDFKTMTLKIAAVDTDDSRGKTRENVVTMTTPPAMSEEERARQSVACVLLRFYLQPIVDTAACMIAQGDEQLNKRDLKLLRSPSNLRRFVLDGFTSGAAYTDTLVRSWGIRHVLGSLRDLAQSEKSDCEHLRVQKDTAPNLDGDAAFVFSKLNEIDQSNKKSKEKFALIDPYIANLVGDILGYSVGPDQEAEFMDIVKSRPGTDSIHPGTISIFFTAANSKLRSATYWPLEDMIADLDKAFEMNRKVLDQATEKLAQEGDKDRKSAYEKIDSNYIDNEASFYFEYIQIYSEASLHGTKFSYDQKADWQRKFGRFLEMMNFVSDSRGLTIDNLVDPHATESDASISAEEKLWKMLADSMESTQKFDYATALALNAVLLTKENDTTSPQACAVAHYYLKYAKDMIPTVAKALKDKFYDSALETNKTRLRGYLSRFEQRLAASCG